MQGYLKQLILEDMKRSANEPDESACVDETNGTESCV